MHLESDTDLWTVSPWRKQPKLQPVSQEALVVWVVPDEEDARGQALAVSLWQFMGGEVLADEQGLVEESQTHECHRDGAVDSSHKTYGGSVEG